LRDFGHAYELPARSPASSCCSRRGLRSAPPPRKGPSSGWCRRWTRLRPSQCGSAST